MNITKEQAKIALSVLTAYINGLTDKDADASTKYLVKQLLLLQEKEDYANIIVDMTQDEGHLPSFECMDDFDDFFQGMLPSDIAKYVSYSKFDPDAPFFYFTFDNEIKSLTTDGLLKMAGDIFNIEDVVQYIIDKNRIVDLLNNLDKATNKR